MPSPIAALALLAAPHHLRPLDLALVAVYLVGITLFGLRFRKKSGAPGAPKQDRSLRSYFLANNTIPWWAISLSIVSAETSTLTIISIPGVAFAGDFGFLQIVIGYMLGRIVVASLFLPRYFAGEMLTAYQLIDRRFGPALHKVTAALFLLTRAAAEGVRVFAVSIVVGIAIGTRDVLSIGIITLLTLLYTFEGGLAAVIWTDVVQMAIYIGGTVVAIATLGTHVAGGWTTIHTVASAAGKFHMLNFALNLTTTYTFWAGVLGGTFLTMASHGTDQLMVQRMLAARNIRESQLALLSSGVVIFIQFALFLLIGAGLYVFANNPGAPGPASGTWVHGLSPDRIFPTFIVREMPLGIAGLLVAAILAAAMSNLSAALNSLSSTTVVDFYIHLRPKAALPENARERDLISKSSTVLWALVLFAIAVYSLAAGGKGHVVEIGLSIASVAYGCLLGVFLLGTLTRFATQTGATIGMVCGFVLNLWLWQGVFPMRLGPLTIPHVAWTWYVLIGAAATFIIGSLASLLFRKQSKRTAIAALALLALALPFHSSAQNAVILSAAKDPRIVQAQILKQAPTQTHAATTPAQNRYPEASASGLIASTKGEGLQPLGYALAQAATTPDFTPITTLINDAIAAHKLPGAVALIGHNHHIVFEQAYGDRKLANEPGPPLAGPHGNPSPAPEPMTEDTIFDMASLSKCLSTATAIMQLYEQGKIASFDSPLEKYLPAFNAPVNGKTDPERAQVTLRMLLTHTSGEAPDVDLRDPWGLAAPDKAEGIHRALTTPLKNIPGTIFHYSDVNFILLGGLVETLSGQPLDVYAQEHIFKPLGMTETRYLPLAKACGPHKVIGAAIAWAPAPRGRELFACPAGDWSTSLLPRIAPTTHDDEGNAQTNPHFDILTRGTVHDPTTRRMGGVAGHAGVFSTAHDISLYAQALLEKLLHNTGPFPLKQSTLQLMTQPEQPDPTTTPGITTTPGTTTTTGAPHLDSEMWASKAANELKAANAAEQAAIAEHSSSSATSPNSLSSFAVGGGSASPSHDPRPAITDPLLAPHYPAIKDQDLRGYGWDIDTAYSKPRGEIFTIGSFGHTGYTGTSLWMDPGSDTYVILLANAVHPRDQHRPISNLRGQVATAAAQALHLYPTKTNASNSLLGLSFRSAAEESASSPAAAPTLTGIDVLERTHFTALANLHHIGLLTNQTGLDSQGRRTIDILITNHQPLTTLFSPEHGIFGKQDSTNINAETDPATGLHVTSLYGAHDTDRRPTHAQLASLDAVVIDLQDAGVHFWTYEAAAGYFLEAAALEKSQYHHDLQIILLDRPNPIGGTQVQGPISDPGTESYVNYMPLPVRHGLTLGELLRYANAVAVSSALAKIGYPEASASGLISASKTDGRGFSPGPANLTVVPMQHWQRTQYFASTGLPWINPSPNLRSPQAAIVYPALGLIETTNLSVGRGTDHPFSFFGAPYIDAPAVTTALTARHIPGVTFTFTTEPITEDANHYPFHGQTIPAVRLTVTNPTLFNSPETGIEILSVLHRLYPTQFKLEKSMTLLCSRSTLDAIQRNDDPRSIASTWQSQLQAFKRATIPYLLYP